MTNIYRKTLQRILDDMLMHPPVTKREERIYKWAKSALERGAEGQPTEQRPPRYDDVYREAMRALDDEVAP